MPDSIWFHGDDFPAHSGQVSGFVVRDDEFLAHPMSAVAVDAPSCRHDFLVEPFIEVPDEWCVVIREHAGDTTIRERAKKPGKTDMLSLPKAVFRVANKARLGEWCVRAVEEDEVTFLGILDAFLKIEAGHLRVELLQECGESLHVLPRVRRAHALVIRHVELTMPIDTEESIETMLVEENEGSGKVSIIASFCHTLVIGIADAVIVGLSLLAQLVVHLRKQGKDI